jgi:hypothetical protein
MMLMIVLYSLGYFFEIYGFGRLISPIIIFSDIVITYALFLFGQQNKNMFRLYAGLVAFAFVVSVLLNLSRLKQTISFAEKNIAYYTKFNALKPIVKENETILTDLKTSLFIPSFQGKVVAVSYPLYWINDIDERRTNVTAFFQTGTSDSTRIAILKKYHPDYILIDYKSVPHSKTDIEFYRTLGTPVYKKDDLELIQLKN